MSGDEEKCSRRPTNNAQSGKSKKENVEAAKRFEKSRSGAQQHKKATCKREEDDYLLEALHKFKNWLSRVGRWLTCYTQYCYPGLRTVDYYRKVEESQAKRRRQKEKEECKFADPKKKPSKSDRKKETAQSRQMVSNVGDNKVFVQHLAKSGAIAATEITSASSDDKAKVDLHELSEMELPGQLAARQSIPAKPSNQIDVDTEALKTKVRHVLNNNLPGAAQNSFDDADTERTGGINGLMENLTRLFVDGGESQQIMDLLKFLCIFLIPATMLLGVRYILVKQKYKRLTGWLKGIRRQNFSLNKETKQLENIILTTEQAMIHFKKSTNKKEVLAQFTSISDNILNYKREIARMTTEKAALIQELKTVKAQKMRIRSRQSCSRPISNHREIVT